VSAERLRAEARPSVTRDASPCVPAHVVYRSFAHETVVLNLRAGRYHSLSPVGGRMLEALESEATVGTAAQRLASEFEDASEAQIEGDLVSFCEDLLELGLIELGPNGRRR
jgi:hypothetical protein